MITVTADRNHLLGAARAVLPAVGRAGLGLRIRNGADGGVVQATDLDLTLQAPFAASGRGANVVLGPRRLTTVLSLGLAGDSVAIGIPLKESERVRLTSGRTSAWLDRLPLDLWPADHGEEGASLVLTAADVATIKAVATSASTDDARPILSAVHLADGFAAATDSYRLSAGRISARGPAVLLPAKAARVLPDAGVTLTVGETGVQWGTATDGGWSRVITGDFPNWQPLVPTAPAYSVEFDREGLVAAVARAEVLIGSDATPMLISKAVGGVQLGARDHGGDLFSETMDEVEADESCPAVAVNPRFLLGILRSFAGRRVRLGITDSLKPVLITADGDDPESFRSLLMPVRIDFAGRRAA